MIAKIAVAAATFAIDKPYSYLVPDTMTLTAGMRVTVPFGRGNRQSEGVVLSVEDADPKGLKSVERCLDEQSLLDMKMLRLAAFLRERYFCTFFDAIRVLLPGGLWFHTRQTFCLTQDRSWEGKTLRQQDAKALLTLLNELGGSADDRVLRQAVPDEEAFESAVRYLTKKKWIETDARLLRNTSDKTEKIATLTASVEEVRQYIQGHRSAAMQCRSRRIAGTSSSVSGSRMRSKASVFGASAHGGTIRMRFIPSCGRVPCSSTASLMKWKSIPARHRTPVHWVMKSSIRRRASESGFFFETESAG